MRTVQNLFSPFLLMLCVLMACNSNSSNKQKSQQDTTQSPTSGSVNWDLAILAYTFRQGTFFEAVDKAKDLGINEIGIFPGQEIGAGINGKMNIDMDSATQQKVKELLKSKDMKLADIGVISPTIAQDWEKLFQFAKSMEIPLIVSEPDPKFLDQISTLTEQNQIKLAIHNHAAPSMYWNPDSLMAGLEGKSQMIGVCADVGHWLRSNLDPLASLKKVESRLMALHFKDVSMEKPEGLDVVWGDGNIPTEDLLKELKASNFSGVLSIEYEGDLEKNSSALKQIMEIYKNQVQQINQE
ncbi:sugar phosphate isomerase/epimerase family protein [Sphingobacterium endophyticum]|uniref:sugar phosphate isomerase/epimerase family protein n=1 Tax=Sphingobacterium endophyticum TaxID=2546448 RepID=UPI0012E25698|nr:sugar phosphate isomerase/epimerase [Sphingobacterium endophyticum]